MDHSASLEKYKLRQFIRRWGKEYSFVLPGKNEFDEPTGEDKVVTLMGVYHENNEYINQSSSDSGTVVTKLNTQILCQVESATDIVQGMTLDIDGTSYQVTGKRDLDRLGIACDISLEEVLK